MKAEKNLEYPQKPLQELVTEMVQEYQDEVHFNPWFFEKNRWYELIVCILIAYGGEARGYARRAVSILIELGFLEIDTLAKIPLKNNVPDFTNPQLIMIQEVLKRIGFAEQNILLSMREILGIVQDLNTKYEGRIQKYLRQYGQKMLTSLNKDFPTLTVADDKIKYAFTLWLQNVLTMPVFATTEATRHFCKKAGCNVDQFEDVIDDLDITASLIDDILESWEESNITA